ncbi:molybdopterin molybdotransferase MoeA [Rhodococcus sp. G-MC3]|uniref:molybdopterin molybdotransferase MoeA n=1 Tax=Rhodococcus sp. G-MC3 TaxID=3046209 RepID=UPI0024BBD46D|nr:gephyrin-like molybdotransferase Glp [Rhodococcus sp. G-MC3]MDJ0392036.1 molybdopterin molybdotransferase MoeA [Rhodococcus sp. G-MC3]
MTSRTTGPIRTTGPDRDARGESAFEPTADRPVPASVEEHIDHVRRLLDALRTRPSDTVSVAEALGRIPTSDVASPVDLPLFRNSQMDGYAVRAVDVAAVPVSLRVAGTIAAGPSDTIVVEPGTAVKIMTGAPVPEQADAIVPVENTVAEGDFVTISMSRAAGEYIREQGSDVTAGTVLVRSGQTLEPRHIAVLAAVGLSHIEVRSRPKVAVITTGAELVDAGSPLRPGQIFDSNGVTLAAHLRANGADVVAVHRSSDVPEDFRRILFLATSKAELVITSGGVSMGDFEVVKDVLATLGGQFGSVRMQPGGPQGTAVVDGVPVLSFPGNPVSTVVSFLMFARAVIRESAGLPPISVRSVPLAHSITSISGKRQLLRGKVEEDGVTLIAGPGSHLVAAMAWADVLVDIPADTIELAAGTNVRVIPL